LTPENTNGPTFLGPFGGIVVIQDGSLAAQLIPNGIVVRLDASLFAPRDRAILHRG
jgi:hypothetical protein